MYTTGTLDTTHISRRIAADCNDLGNPKLPWVIISTWLPAVIQDNDAEQQQ